MKNQRHWSEDMQPDQSPYEPPQEMFNTQEDLDLQPVRKKANLAAVLMIVNAIIGLLLLLVPIQSKEQLLEMIYEMESLGLDSGGLNTDSMIELIFMSSIVFKVIHFTTFSLIIFASVKMRRLESWGLSTTAAILTVIPCTSSCCLIGIPIGVFALMVVFDPNVKAAFRARAAR